MKRLFLGVCGGLICGFGLWLGLWPWPETVTARWLFYDRQGALLYAEPEHTSEALKRHWWLEQAVVALEDQRFYQHTGVDPRAVLRALRQNQQAGGVVSGASTLTMQLSRLRFLPGAERNWWYKIRQAAYAFKLELHYSKDEILQQYLARLNLGQGTRGVEAAAQHYFNKHTDQLSVGEAVALLATVPNPSRFNPVSEPELAAQRQQLVYNRLLAAGVLEPEEYAYWKTQPLRLQSAVPATITAPHAVFWLKSQLESEPWVQDQAEIHVYTTLDKTQYETALRVVRRTLERAGAAARLQNAAVVALDKDNRLRVMLGSPDWFDPEIDGMVNMATARRSSGSTLKPFLYAWALEQGWSPLRGVRDLQTVFADGYLPRNFQATEENGVVRLREALANSYNIAAVDGLQQLGVDGFYRFLERFGFRLNRPPAQYGLALVLGAAEVTLPELVLAYSVFTHQGELQPIQAVGRVQDQNGQTLWRPPAEPSKQVVRAHVAEWGQHVLSDEVARWKNFSRGNALELPFASGAKTGTSQDFVDNWVVGFSPHYTVGVWAGNADGSPMHGSSGLLGAGPIWQGVMQALHADVTPSDFIYHSDRSVTTVCRRPGETACAQQVKAFLRPHEQDLLVEPEVASGLEIYYPGAGDVFAFGSDILLRWRGAARSELAFLVDGELVEGPIISGLSAGKHQLEIRIPSGRFDQVEILVAEDRKK